MALSRVRSWFHALPDGVHRGIDTGREVVAEMRDDRVTDLAAEIAFFAILSLFPAFLSLAAMLGAVGAVGGDSVADRVETQILEGLERVLTDEADGTIEAVNELFTNSSPGLLTFSLLAALWALSRGFAALVRCLDVVYDIDEHRSWLSIRLRALGLGIGSIAAAAIMLAFLVIGPLVGTGTEIADKIGLGSAFATSWDLARIPLAFGALVLWAALIFHIAPDHHTPWRWDLPGAALTGVLWIVFSGGLQVYLRFAGSTNQVFGVLGGALIVLLWFYLLALAVLVGGELNQVLTDRQLATAHDG